MDPAIELEALLVEQRAYYSHIAPNYERYALPGLDGGGELFDAFRRFDARGDALEFACGTGLWTERLAHTAASITAVDASAEMIARAAERVRDAAVPVRFVQGDLFGWRPERRYDVVVFGFWLSHVPRERFREFWRLVDSSLAPDGRVFFADDAHRDPEELVYGEDSEVVQRRLRDGTTHRVVKVPHTVATLQAQLDELGWDIRVHPTAGPFFWGAGGRA